MFQYFPLAVLLGAICIGEAAQEIDQRTSLCPQGNGYRAVEGSCDMYIECRDYSANQMLCPDGLHYNPQAPWPAYPCGYPADVPCQGRGATQEPRPTAECPHQYGFYPSPRASAAYCGEYQMCIEGRAVDMQCPSGLAFNPDRAQCDWPDLVPSCNSEAYLGFTCPPVPLGDDGEPIQDVVNYRYEGDCFAFFSCQSGRARLLSCDHGYAFDPVSGACADSDRVNCDSRPIAIPYQAQ